MQGGVVVVGDRPLRQPPRPEPQARSKIRVWTVGASALEGASAPGVGPATRVAGRIFPAIPQSARASPPGALTEATIVSCPSPLLLQEVGPRRLQRLRAVADDREADGEADAEADAGGAPGARHAEADTEADAGGAPGRRGVVADDGSWSRRVAPALALLPSFEGGTIHRTNA